MIFRLFARAAKLPVNKRSIRSRPDPEPDIRCTIAGEGPVSFELTEVVTPAFAEATSIEQTPRERFRAGYSGLPDVVRRRIETGLGGPPAVLAGFVNDITPGRWLQAVSPILETLSAIQDLQAGEVPVWRIPSLEGILDEMIVQRATGGGPHLLAMEMTEVFDEAPNALKKKFSKRYGGRGPKELVAYYISQSPPDRFGWLGPAEEFIRTNLGRSPFRRVWLFNHFSKTIPLVYPPRGRRGIARPARGSSRSSASRARMSSVAEE